jgi:type II secretory pathway component PulJ
LSTGPGRRSAELHPPHPPQRTREARTRVAIGSLKLSQACRKQQRIVERDERSLEARATKETHGRGVHRLRILLGDQNQQRRHLLKTDMRQIPGRRASRYEVAAGKRAAKTSQRRALRGQEHTFVAGLAGARVDAVP